MIAATGFILLGKQELAQKPSNVSGAKLYVNAAVDVRLPPFLSSCSSFVVLTHGQT